MTEAQETRLFIDFVRLATGKDPLYAPGRLQDYRGQKIDGDDNPNRPNRKGWTMGDDRK